ncbi:methyl-accepting chemotaxis protein [uncultured Thermanaerothrix sp.]|uniref:methyl-accepting chemotaxis protein n=1 Tax=uncultured Thermanaerothrix sp. TaxID=1195149 RepID=UPI0026118C8C|nr:methyl-accepting chemotaxis protein [uncultured Thermanaerothrix sp.]
MQKIFGKIRADHSSRSQVKQGSIRTQVLFYSLALALVPLLVLFALSYLQAEATLRQSATETLSDLADITSAQVRQWLEARQAEVEVMANAAEVVSMEPTRVMRVLTFYREKWGDYFETLLVIQPDGYALVSTDGQRNNMSDREYFKQAMSGQTVISEPLVSKGSQHVVIVFAAPIRSMGQVVGVMAAVVPTGAIEEIFDKARLGQTGDAYLIDRRGVLITPSRFEEQLKAENRIKERSALELRIDTVASRAVLSGQEGNGEYQGYRFRPVVGAYRYVPGVNWGLIVEQDVDEALAAANGLARILIFGAIVMAGLAGLAAFAFANQIARPIKVVSEALSSLSQGELAEHIDVNQRQLVLKRRDEIGQMGHRLNDLVDYFTTMSATAEAIAAGDLTVGITPRSEKDLLGNAFMRMLSSLRQIVQGVAHNAQALEAAATELAEAANQAGQVTGQIATTIQQVAKGASQQSEAASRTAASVEQMTRAIQGVAKGAQEQAVAVNKMSALISQLSAAIQQVQMGAQNAAEVAHSAVETAGQGSLTVESTLRGMAAIREKVTLSAEKVQAMGQRSTQIGAIVETIQDIAAQTNLLALNAAIEAARAGEHGKGFAVVADEVRKLAERAAAATREIGGLIREIRQSVEEAVLAMQESANEVEKDVQQAGLAGAALSDILDGIKAMQEKAEQSVAAARHMAGLAESLVAAADEVSAIAEENTAATEEMSAGSQEITQAVESIASVSEENSAAVEEVSASAEEMSAQVEEVAASAQFLQGTAQALRDAVAQFRLDDSTMLSRGDVAPSSTSGNGRGVLIKAH